MESSQSHFVKVIYFQDFLLPGWFVEGQTLQKSLPVPIQFSFNLALSDHTNKITFHK